MQKKINAINADNTSFANNNINAIIEAIEETILIQFFMDFISLKFRHQFP